MSAYHVHPVIAYKLYPVDGRIESSSFAASKSGPLGKKTLVTYNATLIRIFSVFDGVIGHVCLYRNFPLYF